MRHAGYSRHFRCISRQLADIVTGCSYITQGLSTFVVHTLGNPGGELGAYPFNGTTGMAMMSGDPDSSMPMSAAPAPSMDMTMNMSAMGASTSG